MLIIWNKPLGRTVATIGGENNVDNAQAHVRNGYPHLLTDWNSGSLEAHVIDDFTPARDLKYFSVMDGKPVILTDESARSDIDATRLAERTEKDALVAAEVKIAAEIRLVAIERLEAKGEVIPEKIGTEIIRERG